MLQQVVTVHHDQLKLANMYTDEPTGRPPLCTYKDKLRSIRFLSARAFKFKFTDSESFKFSESNHGLGRFASALGAQADSLRPGFRGADHDMQGQRVPT